jgi:hypothetical protein
VAAVFGHMRGYQLSRQQRLAHVQRRKLK